MFSKFRAFFLIFTAAAAFAQTPTPAASRVEGVTVHYYAALHEAFEAASGTSVDMPDEITVLADIILDKPIIIDTAKIIQFP